MKSPVSFASAFECALVGRSPLDDFIREENLFLTLSNVFSRNTLEGDLKGEAGSCAGISGRLEVETDASFWGLAGFGTGGSCKLGSVGTEADSTCVVEEDAAGGSWMMGALLGDSCLFSMKDSPRVGDASLANKFIPSIG